MRQLDDMFGTNRQLSAKLRNQKDMMRKRVSERNQRKNSMFSVKVQTDTQERPQQKTVHYRSVLVQTEMDKEETSHRLQSDCRTISTQTEIDVLETLKPVSRTISTQMEIDVLETSYRLEPVHLTVELETVCKEDSEPNSEVQKGPVPETVEVQTASLKDESHGKETEIATLQQISEEEAVSVNQPDGDQQDKKKPSRKAKWRIKRKAAIKAASELKNLNKDKVSVPEIVSDQTATIISEIRKTETAIVKPELATEHEIAKLEQSEFQQDEENNETSIPDSETIPEILEIISEQIETKLCSIPEDVTGEFPVVIAEVESGLLEEQRTPPPQMKEDEIQTTSQKSEPLAAKESAEQKSEQEESPRKRISLWRRIKKALTPKSICANSKIGVNSADINLCLN
ncbi:uncharacterized protein LOC107837110 [Poecilia formosa]|uniref:uncharacterized protein LOC107837110 n=1 Tax=Poecilia formosa TaxID=48698 RepID=UPI0007B7E441|nr:PREDICTED: uncharacterized protein LOC107837110 [Poecilia formosa]